MHAFVLSDMTFVMHLVTCICPYSHYFNRSLSLVIIIRIHPNLYHTQVARRT